MIIGFGLAVYFVWQAIENDKKYEQVKILVPQALSIKLKYHCNNLRDGKFFLKQLDPWLAAEIDSINAQRKELYKKDLAGTLKIGELEDYLSDKWLVPNSYDACKNRMMSRILDLSCTPKSEKNIRTCKGQNYLEGFSNNSFCEKFVSVSFYGPTSFENIASRTFSHYSEAGGLDNIISLLKDIIKKDSKNNKEAEWIVSNLTVNEFNAKISKERLIENEQKE